MSKKIGLNFNSTSLGRIRDILIVLIGSLGVMLPISPASLVTPSRDSGVFLYIGWRMINGELPYRHVWDHKPPGIFLINALGLSLNGNSWWGVWLLELIFLFLGAYIGYTLVRKMFGFFPAVCSLLLMVFTLVTIISGGNFTTEYTMLLQFIAFALVFSINKSGHDNWKWVMLGLTGAIAFFFKQTVIGIWLAIIIYYSINRIKSRQTSLWIKEILWMVAGGAFVSGVAVYFMVLNGTFKAFFDAAFLYNFFYATDVTGFGSRVWPVVMGISPLTEYGLFQFGLVGYALCVLSLVYNLNPVNQKKPLFTIILISIPIDLILIGATGYSFSHYYMTLLPSFLLLAGITFWAIFKLVSDFDIPQQAKILFGAGVIGAILWSSFNGYRSQIQIYNSVPQGRLAVLEFIENNTSPEDYVLMWGAESSINFTAQRRSPTKYVYQYPLYTQGYVDEQMILAFLDDILENKPKYIFDTYNQLTPMFAFPIQTESIDAKMSDIENSYRSLQHLSGWTIYRYVGR